MQTTSIKHAIFFHFRRNSFSADITTTSASSTGHCTLEVFYFQYGGRLARGDLVFHIDVVTQSNYTNDFIAERDRTLNYIKRRCRYLVYTLQQSSNIRKRATKPEMSASAKRLFRVFLLRPTFLR